MNLGRRLPILSVLLLAGLLSSGGGARATDTLTPEQRRWVDETLASLSLAQRAAQLLMVRVPAGVHHAEAPALEPLLHDVVELGVGGVVTFRTERDALPWLLNDLQSAAALPLLVASDFERGASFRLRSGSVAVPWAMAIGATRDPEGARWIGELTAREARALGVHWVFAPVVDVSNNPENPVINLRSFGEDPALVSALATAFVEGARRGGVLTSAKHFPGHGDTATDSHLDLPRIEAERSRLDSTELAPFRAAIEAGVDSVMLGHLSVPALDGSGTPATLSSPIARELLRQDLGFEGLIVTDGLEMRGLDGYGSTDVLRRAVAAGAEVLLLPRDARVAVDTLVRSVEEGVLSAELITSAARHVLETKARLSLHESRRVDPALAREVLGHPRDEGRATELAQRAVTLVRNQRHVVPLRVEDSPRILHLALAGSGSTVQQELAQRYITTETVRIDDEIDARRLDELVARSRDFTHVLVSAFTRFGTHGAPALSSAERALLRRLSEGETPLILVAYRNPYLLVEVPEVAVYLTPFGPDDTSQRAVVAALLGERAIEGRLPITLPGIAEVGSGLQLPALEQGLSVAEPIDLGLARSAFEPVERALDDFVAARAFPGGVLAVGYRGQLVHLYPFGKLSYDEESAAVTADTRYDLASLTKVVVTTTLAMQMVDEGRLDLDAPIARYLPRFQGPQKEQVTARHLLTHSSGLDWWAPLHLELQGRRAYVERIQAMDLVYEPGTAMRYSDLGIVLLGEILERIAGQSLDELANERIFSPLGMERTGFRPARREWESIAPTELDPWRQRVLQGEVHDENAFALGGVAPHAGLFGTAPDLARFAQMLLYRGVWQHRRLVAPATVDLFTRDAQLPRGSRRALGWDTRSPEGSSAGSLFSFRSFGHTGFTGTSVWIDPARELFVILLTNRVHPSRENRQIRDVRPRIADLVVRAIAPLAEPPEPPREPVMVGLDRIDRGEEHGLAGKRLGVVVHAASVTLDGKHAIDALREASLDVVRILTPEHGLASRAAAGEAVADSVDPRRGIPVVSLYGSKTRPTPEDLADLDALVFDLQGAGVRFYTYVSTMIECLEAAAEAGLEFVVLDRPNPLGGELVAGPVSASRDQVPSSFVNRAPGPLIHGLTLGEMARLVNAALPRPATLTVVPMEGWQRSMTWADTGRRWTSPSPNLRSAGAALAYPGIALLEATNLSEGRGTHQPFLLFGAPWLEGTELPGASHGFELRPTRFVPRRGLGASHPKHRDETCFGYEVIPGDPREVEPWALGVDLLHRLHRQPGFAWNREGGLDWLLGSPELGTALERGVPLAEILAADRPAAEAWRQTRRPFLLYD